MMKKIIAKVKSIPFRVFIMVLSASIIGISGVLILKHNIDSLSDSYREIIEEHNVNRTYMEQISQLLYQHRSIVAIHVASKEAKDRAKYEETEQQLREKMGTTLAQFRRRMTGNEREQVYHRVYSDYYSYLQNVDITLQLSREGSVETSVYYLTGQMSDFLESVNKNLSQLEQLTLNEMKLAQEKMNSCIDFSHVSTTICIIMISATMLICLIYCVTITSHLEQYKENLEQEIEQKNLSITQHNEKMLADRKSVV